MKVHGIIIIIVMLSHVHGNNIRIRLNFVNNLSIVIGFNNICIQVLSQVSIRLLFGLLEV